MSRHCQKQQETRKRKRETDEADPAAVFFSSTYHSLFETTLPVDVDRTMRSQPDKIEAAEHRDHRACQAMLPFWTSKSRSFWSECCSFYSTVVLNSSELHFQLPQLQSPWHAVAVTPSRGAFHASGRETTNENSERKGTGRSQTLERNFNHARFEEGAAKSLERSVIV